MGLKATCNLLGIEDMRRELFSYCNATPCGECLFKFRCDFNRIDEEEIEVYYRGSCDFDSMTDNREIRALYEAVYYGEIEQAKEYLKQRVQLIGEELVVELPKDAEDKSIKITFVKCDKIKAELKERKKGKSEA